MAGYRDKGWVTPKDSISYYVYALLDTNGFPFYTVANICNASGAYSFLKEKPLNGELIG